MAIAESCGHDRRGNETEQDDINEIATNSMNGKRKST